MRLTTNQIRIVVFQKIGVCFEERAIFCGTDDSAPGECTELALTQQCVDCILEVRDVFSCELFCCCNAGLVFGLEADV